VVCGRGTQSKLRARGRWLAWSAGPSTSPLGVTVADMLSRTISAWRGMTWLARCERIALALVWLMLIVVFFNFDHFPVVLYHGQYFVKGLGYVPLRQAMPYLLMEYGFFFVAAVYVSLLVVARIARARAARRASSRDA